jgi:hypothetical protein
VDKEVDTEAVAARRSHTEVSEEFWVASSLGAVPVSDAWLPRWSYLLVAP